jgi:hypothetical protein
MSSKRVFLYYISLDASRICSSLCLFIAFFKHRIISKSKNSYTDIISYNKSTSKYSVIEMYNNFLNNLISNKMVYLYRRN